MPIKCALLLLLAAPLAAQSATDPYRPPVKSLGLPPRFTPYGGVIGLADFSGPFAAGAHLFGGARHEVIRPALGFLGVAAEGYTGIVGNEVEGGGRIFATMRALLIQAGVEFASPNDWTPRFIMTLEDPIVRGGFLRRGGMVRAQWTPAAGRLGLGMTFPIVPSLIGKTRPVTIAVPPAARPPFPAVDVSLPDSARTILEMIRASAVWIDELTTPFLPSSQETDREWQQELAEKIAFMHGTDAEHPEGHTYPQEVACYHRLLHRFFAAATGSPTPDLLVLARRVVLEDILLAMNRDFGRLRGPEVFAGYRALAVRRFATELEPGTSAATRRQAQAAFDAWLSVLATVENRARHRWHDSRLMWLPFQLALMPEEHDTQEEIDRLLERVLQRKIEGGNDYAYLVNEAFSPELIRSIQAARDYHVLWVHDFPGSTQSSTVDRVAAGVVIEGYLSALTTQVRSFNRTGRLPVYLLFLDQSYFDSRRGRWWMRPLSDPLGVDFQLPEEGDDVQIRLRAAQGALRQAVAQSERLQALAESRGREWLRRYVKVHVNVTYPGDPSFRRRIPARGTPLMFADDYMRDHRKVAFWDLSEVDPGRGGALFTGEGVGEQYESSRWEDRSLLVRGPAALPLKAEARQLLFDHGILWHDLPESLLPDTAGAETALSADSLWSDWTTRLLQVSNATGYGPKQASLLRAALYTLLPPGTRIVAPDAQWSSLFWAGMLAGSALRGCQVFVIAPKLANAPYAMPFIQSILAHDVLEGYLQLRTALGPALQASGGAIHVGLYGQDIGTRSLRQRYLGVIDGMRQPRFPRAAFPFPDEVYRQLGDVPLLEQILAPALDSIVDTQSPTPPMLHLKSQLVMSAAGVERILRDPGWFQVFSDYVHGRVDELARDRSQGAAGRMTPALLGRVDSTLRRAPADEMARDVFYLVMGSQNMNDRSLLLDGEIVCLIAGAEALATLIDFVAIAARSTWVETIEELDALIPRQPRDKVKLARSFRSLF